MRSLLLAAALTLILSACATNLRPVVVDIIPITQAHFAPSTGVSEATLISMTH